MDGAWLLKPENGFEHCSFAHELASGSGGNLRKGGVSRLRRFCFTWGGSWEHDDAGRV